MKDFVVESSALSTKRLGPVFVSKHAAHVVSTSHGIIEI